MRILISIALNAFILYAMYFLLGENPKYGLEAWIIVEGGWIAFISGWIILWLINVTIKPI